MRRPFRIGLTLAACLFGATCGVLDYDGLPEGGRFEGAVLVLWVSDNETGLGDGRFVYIPFPGRELTFYRDVSANPDATLAVIQPGPIYTDGGSIPRAIQPFRGFSPWGYAPAYMVHDWLFVAKRCGRAEDGGESPVAGMLFPETAEIMGEAIKALIRQKRVIEDDAPPAAISRAVAGPFSERLWEKEGTCVKGQDLLTDAHAAEVAEFQRRRARSLRRFGVTDRDREGDTLRVVGVVEF